MPLFMFLSGFCAYYSFPIKNRKVFLKKKLFGLYLPYCSWSILLLLITHLRSRKAVSMIEVANTIMTSGFWFLRILIYIFLLVLLFDLLDAYLKRKRYILPHHAFIISGVIVVAIAFFASYLPGCGNLYKHFLFFGLGAGVHYFEDKSSISDKDLTADICGVLIVFLYIVSVLTVINSRNTAIVKIADMTAAFFGTIGVYYLCKKLSHCFIGGRSISELGRMTLGVYAFHWNILFALKLGDFTDALSFIQSDVMISIMIAVIWICISFFAVIVLNRWKWSRCILLGSK